MKNYFAISIGSSHVASIAVDHVKQSTCIVAKTEKAENDKKSFASAIYQSTQDTARNTSNKSIAVFMKYSAL